MPSPVSTRARAARRSWWAVTICGSAVIGLAVAERHLDGAGAWTAGQLDELWQAEQWGTDPLAAAAATERQAALNTAVRLLDLLQAFLHFPYEPVVEIDKLHNRGTRQGVRIRASTVSLAERRGL